MYNYWYINNFFIKLIIICFKSQLRKGHFLPFKPFFTQIMIKKIIILHIRTLRRKRLLTHHIQSWIKETNNTLEMICIDSSV